MTEPPGRKQETRKLRRSAMNAASSLVLVEPIRKKAAIQEKERDTLERQKVLGDINASQRDLGWISVSPARVSGHIRARTITDTAMPTNFFNFAAEIRLKIYEELLVLSEPITFKTTCDPSWLPLFLSKRYGLCLW